MDAVSIRSQKFIEQQLTTRQVADISLLPKEIRRAIKKEAKAIAQQDVFGVDHKTAKDGTPIEQGLGSAGNMTQQAVEAYIKYQTDKKFRSAPEEGYEENLKKMRAQLATCNTRRRAEAAAADDDDDD